jgi:hypothetical protein
MELRELSSGCSKLIDRESRQIALSWQVPVVVSQRTIDIPDLPFFPARPSERTQTRTFKLDLQLKFDFRVRCRSSIQFVQSDHPTFQPPRQNEEQEETPSTEDELESRLVRQFGLRLQQ